MESVCEKRLELIRALECGNLSKELFIEANYELIKDLKSTDYGVSTVHEGIVKYHYFNTMAKKTMLEADIYEYRNPYEYRKLRESAYDFYLKKEKITLGLLETVNYQAVDAYFIQLRSQNLSGQIFEIVFKDLEKVILHSKDKKILHKLKTNGCFDETLRPSAIDDYVNTRI